MLKKSTVQRYINNFRRRIGRYLKPGIGLRCLVHQAVSGGAILEFKMGPEVENDDTYREPVATLGRALASIEQHAFGGNLDGFMFSGTNLILEPTKIILIKDQSPSEWSDDAAHKDIQKIISGNQRRAR